MTAQEQIKQLFSTLSIDEKKSIVKELLDGQIDKPDFKGIINVCPHCKSLRFIKYGNHNETQRYLCNDCHRTFSIITGTAYNYIKKKVKFEKCKGLLLGSGYLTVKQVATQLKISEPTALTWRHKILLALPESKEKFAEETEIDDIWFLYSQKGRKGLKYSRKRGGSKRQGDNDFQVKLLVAANKQHNDMKVTRIGRITKADIERKFGNKINKDTILISDSHKSIAGFANDKKIKHIRIKAKEHTNNQGQGVQLVNNLAGRFDTVINRILRGVSTKYLQHYANWFSFKENIKNNNKNAYIIDSSMLLNKKTWDVFSNTEEIYKRFIERFSRRTYRCPVKKSFKANNWNKNETMKFAYI
jgi:transposase-like protein